jgi:hypothetical protein
LLLPFVLVLQYLIQDVSQWILLLLGRLLLLRILLLLLLSSERAKYSADSLLSLASLPAQQSSQDSAGQRTRI